jgi:aminoglycoside phosphotransferase family enzyme/predicted kinase
VAEQEEVIAFLAAQAPELVETHISIVFLGPGVAYKLKRAVCFPYLDYSTLALRKKYCAAELVLNRRTAPEIYRCVRAITRAKHGGLEWDGAGEAVDYVLEMARFAQGDLFDAMAQACRLTPCLMRDLADEIWSFHQSAAVVPGGGAAALRAVAAGNAVALAACCPPLARDAVAALNAATCAALEVRAKLLDERAAAGFVRHCHGDLHLRNIVLWQGRPVLFDGIEFSEEFACIDVLYDLAFLLMDVLHRGEHGFAALLLNRYFDRDGGTEGLAVLPLFMSLRAGIRAHVSVAQGKPAEGVAYLALAQAALAPGAARLVAIGGFSGTGKSTLAAALAPSLPPMPGARVIRSDVLRKRLAGLAPEVRLPAGAYTRDASLRVYAEMLRQAEEALEAGYAVILDAAFLRAEERAEAEALAARIGVSFTGFWLKAPEEVLSARLEARRGDASDADTEVLRQQAGFVTGAVDWQSLDAALSTAVMACAARRVVFSRPAGGASFLTEQS